ncbi:MAG: hypothetical protein FWD31_07495 [Planctomycetaceae bacterium]|nr:hypothetical protein [Planctomycetaceae bacterium]
MTTDTLNHEEIRSLLVNALRQVETTQSQVTVVEGQLHELKSQIDLSLEAIDSILKQLENREQQAEKVRDDVAATLSEMFEQMTQIVNGARDQMLQCHDGEAPAQPAVEMPLANELSELPPLETVVPAEPQTLVPPSEATTETVAEDTTEDTTVNVAENVMDEPTPAETLTGPQVEQRATESLNEMIATIDDTNPLPETQAETKPGPMPVTEKVKTPGSADSLNALLAKARAVSGETDKTAAELPPLVDDEEDAQALSELLKNTSGSFVAH